MHRQTIVVICLVLSVTPWGVRAGDAFSDSPGPGTRTHAAWRSIGPAPPAINVPVVADPVSHTVYIGSAGGGVLKSTNDGATFLPTNNGLGSTASTRLSTAARGRTGTVDPHHHSTVYFPDNGAVTGLWRSRDGGNNWVEVDATDNFISVTVDPTDSNIVYADALGTGGYAVLKSTDGGASFRPKSMGLPTGEEPANTGFLLVSPQHPNVLYVGSEVSGVFESTDAAETWFPINSGLSDTEITALAMDPDSPDTVYAATYYRSVFKTVTGGR